MRVKIDVTEEDIKNGKKDSCGFCPVALAIRRVVLPSVIVKVYHNHLIIGRYQTQIKYLPFTVTNFITRFDRHELVKPLSFELDIWELYLNDNQKIQTSL